MKKRLGGNQAGQQSINQTLTPDRNEAVQGPLAGAGDNE
jgi:hypothetical protein